MQTDNFRKHGWKTAALAAAIVLSACGSDLDDINPDLPEMASVTVIGDSLADVGVTGVRYTIQPAPGQAPFPLWPEVVADTINAPRPCRAYIETAAATFEPQPNCRGYAVAGGRIQHPEAQTPRSILLHLKDAADRAGDSGFKSHEVLLIDGGGNDAADLITAYFTALTTLDVTKYADFLAVLLGQEHTWELLLQPQGWENAGQAYMAELSRRFAAAIQQNVLEHGAQRVVVVNMPDVTLTPRFRAILNLLGGLDKEQIPDEMRATSGDLAQHFQALFQAWVKTFNQTLSETLGTDQRVAIMDLYAELTQWTQRGEEYGLTNVTNAACPVKDPKALLPEYDITQCTVAYLDANPPAGTAPGAGWWKTYAFADGFHPSPRGHELVSEAIVDILTAHGWKP